MCFDLVWYKILLSSLMVLLLSHTLMVGDLCTPTSSRIRLSQIATHVALHKYLYSASMDEKETISCFLLLQATIPDPRLN